MKERIHNKKELIERRKKLRNNATAEEKLLWKYLKNSSVANAKFRRQHSIGYYILDFYCPEVRLAVELDGSGHFTDDGKEYDKNRDDFLLSLNIKTIRFSNNEVKNNMNGVLEVIASEVEERRTTPQPPPKLGGGDATTPQPPPKLGGGAMISPSFGKEGDKGGGRHD